MPALFTSLGIWGIYRRQASFPYPAPLTDEDLMADKKTESEAKAPAPAAAEGAKPMTKKGAVEQAVKALGEDAPRGALQTYIRETFGMEIDLDHISATKSTMKQEKAKKPAAKKPAAKKPAAKKPAAAAAPAAPAPAAPPAPPAAASGSAAAVRLDDVLLVKDLLGRLGGASLRTLIEAFGG
ncbi:MAG: hypothetical protein U0736_18275, partial [Gemmataceae bacterium]